MAGTVEIQMSIFITQTGRLTYIILIVFADVFSTLAHSLKIEKIRETAQHAKLIPVDRMPTPKRGVILEWLGKISREFPNEMVKNLLLVSRYVYQSDVAYGGATESDED